MHTLVVFLAVAFIIVPFSLLVLFRFFSALHHSFQDWSELEDWRDIAEWVTILVLEIGGVGLYGFLVYSAILALDRGVGF